MLPMTAVYKCPGDRSVLARSVSMNNRMNPTLPGLWLHGGGDQYAIFEKDGQIRTPADVYVTLDERQRYESTIVPYVLT